MLNDINYNMLKRIDDETFLEPYKIGRDYKNPKALKKLKENLIN